MTRARSVAGSDREPLGGPPDDFAPILQVVRHRIETGPDAVAVAATGDAEALTYAQLGSRAGRIAQLLAGTDVSPQRPVAVLLPRSAELPVAALAAWLRGAPYVLLDPAHPSERLAMMLADCQPAAVLTSQAQLASVPAALADRTFEVDALPPASHDVTMPAPNLVLADDIAYIVYTSGSTGQPKGVMVSHRSLANLVTWHVNQYSVMAADRCALVASPGFDAAVWELWPALAAGATVHVPAEDDRWDPMRLRAWLLSRRITLAFVPTLIAAGLMDLDWPSRTPLRALLTGGDRLARAPNRQLPFRVFNHYGVAECAVVSTAGEVSARASAHGPPTIGRPIRGTGARILAADGAELPSGEVGEFCIDGVSLARGYIGQPAMTASRFVPNPAQCGQRMYRTGDYGYRTISGNLMFVGRRDGQIKVRGQRIELGEVEAALASHPNVRAAAVVATTGDDGGPRLVAYYVPMGLGAAETDLWAHLSRLLSHAMMPATFVALADIPTTANGKVDRAALASAALRGPPAPSGGEGGRVFVGETTGLVAGVFAEVLSIEPPGPEGNFFRLGGDSLLAVEVASCLMRRSGRRITPRAVFEEPTVVGLASWLEVQPAVTRPFGSETPPDDAPRLRELSAAERGVWFQSRMAGALPAYNIGFAYQLDGPVDVDLLRRAVQALSLQHEALRTTYTETGDPRAEVHPHLRPGFEVRDVPAAGAAGWRLSAEVAAQTPFDLVEGPLLRVLLLRESSVRSVMVLIAHHLICDGVSVQILLRDLATAYNDLSSLGQLSAAPSEPFRRYAEAQRAWLIADGQARLDAVADRLEHATGHLVLPCSEPNSGPRTFRGGRNDFALPQSLQQALRSLGAQAGASLYMTMFAGLVGLLRRYGATGDIVVGMPYANRDDVAYRDTVGLFVHILGICLPDADDHGFLPLLGTVRDAVLDGTANGGVAYEDATQRLRRTGKEVPTIRVVCTQQRSTALPALNGARVSELGGLDRGVTEYDLVLSVIEQADGGFSAAFEYATDVVTAADAERMADHLLRLLSVVVVDPEMPLSAIPLLSATERGWFAQHESGATTRTTGPGDHVVHLAVAAAAARRPGAVAVCDGRAVLNYGELECRANGLAHELRRIGIRPGDRVALILPRGVDLAVAILGTLKAGAAYVPVDPTHPVHRVSLILRDCGALAIVTTDGARAPRYALPMLDLSRVSRADRPPPVALTGDDLAYVLYTSGSTGRPKGVMVTHGALCNYARWFTSQFSVSQDDRVLASTTPSFDAFGIELFPALFAGGSVVMADPGLEFDPPALLKLAAAERITVLATVPTMLRLWVAEPTLADCKSVRQIFCGGEALDRDLVRRLFERLPVAIHNLYGPTEATIDVTYRSCRPRDAGLTTAAVPIGRPLSGATVAVGLPDGGPAPLGLQGELFVSGVPLARGYLDRPAETAAQFVPDPGGPPGARRYATGDRVVWLASGELLFCGRSDGQVKLHGYRIELEEIAAVLRACPGVAEAAVAVVKARSGNNLLVAYVVPAITHMANGESTGLERLTKAVLEAARSELPRQMVPSRILCVGDLPRLPNGKLNQAALPTVDRQPLADEDSSPGPARDVALSLRNIFREVLMEDNVGFDDSFFEWGGDSISAIQVVARAAAAGIRVAVADVLSMETVRRLASHVSSEAADAEGQPIESGEPESGSGASDQVPLTPIQRWFLARPLDPGRTQQYCILSADPTVSPGSVAQALSQIVATQDALRMVWERTTVGWSQRVAAPTPVELHRLEVPPEHRAEDGLPSDDFLRSQLSSFEVARAPALRAHLLSSGGPAFLLLTIHHRAVDAVSWAILLSELRGRLTGATLAPAGSYAAYARALNQAARTETFAADRRYWRQRLRAVPPPLSADADQPGPYVRRRIRLPAGTLARGVPPRDALLGAVVGAVSSLSGEDSVLVDLEGHGREVLPDPYLATTVGWFTALFPIVVRVPEDNADLAAAASVALRDLPRHGSGYGVLRYLDSESALPPTRVAEVSLNYLGRYGAAGRPADMPWWSPVGWPVRVYGERDLPAGRLMDVDAVLAQGELLVDLNVRTSPEGGAVAAETLADRFTDALRALTANHRGQEQP